MNFVEYERLTETVVYTSHPPHYDGAAMILAWFVPDAFLPCFLLWAVEDNEMFLVYTADAIPIVATIHNL